MAKVERYRNNGIEVRKKQDGSEELRINGTVIEVSYDPSPHGEIPHDEAGHGETGHGETGHREGGHDAGGHSEARRDAGGHSEARRGVTAHGGYRSRYAFMHAATLPELGQLIVDTQQSLTEPELPGLKPEKEDAS